MGQGLQRRDRDTSRDRGTRVRAWESHLQPRRLLLPGLGTGREVLGLEMAPVGGPSFTLAPTAPEHTGTWMTRKVRPLKLPLYFAFLWQNGL